MIPKIIHQSWKVEQVPERWLAYQETWRAMHPGYEYRFWTDDANRAFVAEHFPALLPVYDGYRHPVCRADLARCLVVCHYGGVYADLDCECLRPLDDLLEGRALVFGLEPQSHVDKPAVAIRGYSRIVCNAIFASVPQHPFWHHLIPLFMARRDEGNILEATGPFVITRALDSFGGAGDVTILPSDVFYPLDHFLRDVDSGGVPGGPYTIHHWAGTWWRDAVLSNARWRIVASRNAGQD